MALFFVHDALGMQAESPFLIAFFQRRSLLKQAPPVCQIRNDKKPECLNSNSKLKVKNLKLNDRAKKSPLKARILNRIEKKLIFHTIILWL